MFQDDDLPNDDKKSVVIASDNPLDLSSSIKYGLSATEGQREPDRLLQYGMSYSARLTVLTLRVRFAD